MAVHELRHPATGEEMRAETGLGRVVKIEPQNRNAKVTIRSDEHGVNIPLVCYVEKQGQVWDRVQRAHEAMLTIWYRIDIHRRAKVDPTLALNTLSPNQKIRDLIDITLPHEIPDQLLVGGVPALTGGAYAAAGPAPQQAQQHVEEAWGQVLHAGAQHGAQGVQQPVSPEWAAAAAHTMAQAPKPGPPPGYQQPTQQQGRQQGQNRRDVRQQARQEARVGNSNRPNTAVMEEAVRAVYDAAAYLAINGGSQKLLNDLSDQALEAGATREVVLNAREQGGLEGEQRAQRQAASRAAVQRQRDPDRVGERAPQAPPMPEHPGGQQGHPQAQGQGSGQGSGQGPGQGQMGARSGFSPRPIATDDRPWMPNNSDGRPNLSSYAAGAVMEFVALAGKLRVDRTRARHEEDPAVPLDPPTEQQVFQLAKHLLHLADTIQHHARGGGRVDRMAGSHKLARKAVREALHVFPIPWGADTAGMAQWSQLMIGHGTALMNVTWRLYVGDVEGEQSGGGQDPRRAEGGDRHQDR
jgi:hypothetical protein